MMQYTLCSSDPRSYNTIRSNISNPILCKYVTLTVTSLTTNCNIRVLSENDYLMFNVEGLDESICISFEDQSGLEASTFVDMINTRLEEAKAPIEANVDGCNRISFFSQTNAFEISD